MTTSLFVNGVIRGAETARSDLPAWVMVEGDRIAAVGDGDDDRPSAERVLDLQGGTLIPAFCDAHLHLPATGLSLSGMDFRGTTSVDEIVVRFQERAAEGGLLYGGGFEDPLDRPMSRVELDRAVGPAPAMLSRADMHSCVVSSALLDNLDLTGLEGVDVDADGSPTGYLREKAEVEAWRWFEATLPRSQQVDAIKRAIDRCYAKGVGTVHEMFVVEWRGWDSYDVFEDAVAGAALNILVYVATDEVDKVASLGHDRVGGDYFLDGSFGSHTAWMKEPFASRPPAGTPATGMSYRSDDEVYDFFSAAQRAGLQVGVHAIGDAAIEQAVTTWERVAAEVGVGSVRALRHRVEHFECASDDVIERAAALGVVGSIQPAFDAFWGGPEGLYARRIGWERARGMNRFSSMARAGLRLAAGSDSTVTPLDPFLQLKALRAHHLDDERLDGATALAVHTAGGHFAGRQENERGTIAPGRRADLAWLDRDPVTTDPDDLLATEVLGTWIGGARVHPYAEADAE